MPVTADDIRNVAFSVPPIGKRGYNEDQVDDFLDELEARFRDPADPRLAHLTPDAVRAAAFGKPSMGRRGYNKFEVDALLELCADTLERLPSGGGPAPAAPGSPTPGSPTPDAAATPAGPARRRTGLTADDILPVRFGKPGFLRRGYSETQVDDFLDALAARFRDPHDPAVAWLTPDAIGEARFAPPPRGRAGYRIEDVDRFLALCRDELEMLLRDT